MLYVPTYLRNGHCACGVPGFGPEICADAVPQFYIAVLFFALHAFSVRKRPGKCQNWEIFILWWPYLWICLETVDFDIVDFFVSLIDFVTFLNFNNLLYFYNRHIRHRNLPKPRPKFHLLSNNNRNRQHPPRLFPPPIRWFRT